MRDRLIAGRRIRRWGISARVMIPGDRVSSQYSAANRRMASSAVIVGLAYTFKRTVFIDRLGLDGTWHKVCLVATGNPLVGGSTHS
jgi:histidyl-tRNA synthetase